MSPPSAVAGEPWPLARESAVQEVAFASEPAPGPKKTDPVDFSLKPAPPDKCDRGGAMRGRFDQFAKQMTRKALAHRGTVRDPPDPAKRTEEDEEYIMAMQSTLDIYIEQWKQEGRDQGLRDGRDQGLRDGLLLARREDVVEAYTARFGDPPSDVTAIIGGTSDLNLLRSWHRLAAAASAEETATAIRAGRATVASPSTG